MFYVGLEGLGALDMETDRNENVHISSFCGARTDTASQGVKGEFKLSGSTPELGDFTIRIVDSESSRTPLYFVQD
jgi:mannosyl-oligosaccharide glucosidase